MLAARAGLLTKQEALDAIAGVASDLRSIRAGREWRDLEDTTNDPIIAMRRPLSWLSWQRSEDYYSEGELVWLDVDTLIRQLSGGKRSLDDFAKAFFGVDNGSTSSHPRHLYVRGRGGGAPMAFRPTSWASFLHERLEGHGPGAPLDGLTRGGDYRPGSTSDTESSYLKSAEAIHKVTDLSFSIGLIDGKEGVLSDVAWDGPAFKAGLTADTQIIAVNGNTYDPDGLKDAITAAHKTATPLQLLVKNNDSYRTVSMDYRDGLRYPHLERIEAPAPSLDAILRPRP